MTEMNESEKKEMIRELSVILYGALMTARDYGIEKQVYSDLGTPAKCVIDDMLKRDISKER